MVLACSNKKMQCASRPVQASIHVNGQIWHKLPFRVSLKTGDCAGGAIQTTVTCGSNRLRSELLGLIFVTGVLAIGLLEVEVDVECTVPSKFVQEVNCQWPTVAGRMAMCGSPPQCLYPASCQPLSRQQLTTTTAGCNLLSLARSHPPATQVVSVES